MTSQKKWLHGILWIGLYLFWIMVFQQRAFAFSRTVTVEFCYLLFIAANFYFNVLYTIPAFLYRKKYGSFAVLMLGGIVVAALLRVPLAMYLNREYFLPGKPQPEPGVVFANSLLNIFIWVFCLVAAKLTIDRFRFQQYIDEVSKQKEQAELDFLNAQFNPHFLFNSINSIYGHIDKHNTTARKMLLTFSDMLRYQLYDCSTNTIDIEKEVNYIRNYVALQQARRDEGLVVEMCVAENVKGFAVAPLLFIAFIENSFKYAGNGETEESAISIRLAREDGALTFKCRNTRDVDFADNQLEHKGIGIANAKRRLALLYPKKHELAITDEKHFYEVNLKLVLE